MRRLHLSPGAIHTVRPLEADIPKGRLTVVTGVSGSGAQRIGMKLKQASQTRQIICVTHSAQIAAYADNQMLIAKSVHEGRTFTTVKTLTRPERVNELARIVSGDAVTEIALSNADEMLTLAGN